MADSKKKKIAITHASGLLGEALLESLASSGVDAEQIELLDSEDMAGNRLAFGSTYLDVQSQHDYDYENLLAVLLLEADAELESLLQHADCPVISHHLDVEEPVVFNPLKAGARLPLEGAVQLPSAQLSTLLIVIQAIAQAYQLTQLNVVNVISASFFGKSGVDELASQTISLLNSQTVKSTVFPMQLAFNMFATESVSDPESILVDALQIENLSCSVQEILVPAFHGLAIAVTLQSCDHLDLEAVAGLLADTPGLQVLDQPASPLTHCSDSSDIIIQQLSQPQNDGNRLQFWIFADSVKNGLLQNYKNTVEILLKSFL